jgi:hypothetical protein
MYRYHTETVFYIETVTNFLTLYEVVLASCVRHDDITGSVFWESCRKPTYNAARNMRPYSLVNSLQRCEWAVLLESIGSHWRVQVS